METLTSKRQHGGHKQTLTSKRQRRPDSPAAAAGLRLILNNYIDEEGGSVADAKTTAASCTSSGRPFSISFGTAVPPACCCLHFDWLAGGGGMAGDSDDGKHPKSSEPDDVRVIAGHDDAVLIQIRMSVPRPDIFEYFLYEAGGGARPPSLSLLPGCYIPSQFDRMNRTHPKPTPGTRYLRMEDTGILRRGEDDKDLVVCQFDMTCDPPIFNTGTGELCMLRIGRGWIFKRVPIVDHREGSSSCDELEPWYRRRSLIAEAAVPVGNRFLCWVHYSNGLVVCDMADEDNPKLRYVRLPATATRRDAYWLDDNDLRRCRTLGAAGPDTVRFVSVAPPPCGADGRLWKRSSSSFKVMTWTMKLSTEEATTWAQDVVLDCDEIWKWRLPSYGCLPCDKRLEYPMVSSDDPDVIYFRAEGMAVEINTRSMKIMSVVPASGTRDQHEDRPLWRGTGISITAKLRW